MPKTVNKLFEIMQEYCKSDRDKRQRIEEMNEHKKAKNSQFFATEAVARKTAKEPEGSKHGLRK